MDLLPINTPRLTLRRFIATDLAAFQAYRADPLVSRYQDWELMSDDEAKVFLKVQGKIEFGTPGQWLQVAIARRETDEIIGDVGLYPVGGKKDVIELGYTLAQSAQKQGYATEAVVALIDAMIDKGNVRSVVAVTDTRNAASIALLRRAGFMQDNVRTVRFRGETCQEFSFVMTKKQWVNRNKWAQGESYSNKI